MGLCCGRQTNEFEVLFDDFFNKMNITNEGSDKIYEIIIDNLNDKNKFYEGKINKFLDGFIDKYVINSNNLNDDSWKIEVKNLFHHQFNNYLDEGFFNFTAILLLLSKDINTKAYNLIKLAKRFNIEVKNDRQISKTVFESLIMSLVRFFTIETIIFIKDLTHKEVEFKKFITKYFTEKRILSYCKQIMSRSLNKTEVDVIEFLLQYHITHYQIRFGIYEIND